MAIKACDIGQQETSMYKQSVTGKQLQVAVPGERAKRQPNEGAQLFTGGWSNPWCGIQWAEGIPFTAGGPGFMALC